MSELYSKLSEIVGSAHLSSIAMVVLPADD